MMRRTRMNVWKTRSGLTGSREVEASQNMLLGPWHEVLDDTSDSPEFLFSASLASALLS